MRRRQNAVWALIAAGGVLGISGCGLGSTHTAQSALAAHPGQIAQIYPTPAGTEDGTAPQMNGSVWVLAASAGQAALYPLLLTHKTVGTKVTVSATTNQVVVLPPSGPLVTSEDGSHPALVWRSVTTGKPSGPRVPLAGSVEDLASGSTGQHLYAVVDTGRAAEVVMVATQSQKVVAQWAVPEDTVSVCVAPSGQDVYTLSVRGQITEWSVASHDAISHFAAGHSGEDLTINPAGTVIYALKGRGAVRNIAEVSISTESVVRVIAAPAAARRLVMAPNGRSLYAIVGTVAYGNVQTITNIGGKDA